MCSLCPSHSWLILQGTCAQMQCLLALTPRPESQPGTIITRQCPSGGITLLFFESKERHFVICLPGMLVFSPTLKNYQKPLVINTNCPLLNSVQHSRKAVFLCQITWRSLCVELTDGVHWWRLHSNAHRAQESTLGLWGSARKWTRVGSKGCGQRKSKEWNIVHWDFLFSVMVTRTSTATFLKQMCLVFVLL